MLSPATHSAADIIQLLQLEPLPHEGGFFRRVAAAASTVTTPRGPRQAWSMIQALFTPPQFSAWHRVAADELWCFQAGDPLDLFVLPDQPPATRITLSGNGTDPLQHAVPARAWQAARVAPGGAWSLVSCIVVPGFDWADFELGARDALLGRFAGEDKLIHELSRTRAQ